MVKAKIHTIRRHNVFVTKSNFLDNSLHLCYNKHICTCGGIGRRARLRIWCPRREGSSPFRCTTSHRAAVLRSLCIAKTSFLCRTVLLCRPKPSLGSPVRLQARSRRLTVALGFGRGGAPAVRLRRSRRLFLFHKNRSSARLFACKRAHDASACFGLFVSICGGRAKRDAQ